MKIKLNTLPTIGAIYLCGTDNEFYKVTAIIKHGKDVKPIIPKQFYKEHFVLCQKRGGTNKLLAEHGVPLSQFNKNFKRVNKS